MIDTPAQILIIISEMSIPMMPFAKNVGPFIASRMSAKSMTILFPLAIVYGDYSQR